MTISQLTRANVSLHFKHRCCYCLVEARYVYASMELDHIIPRALGGSDDEHNLCLACPRCNKYKKARSDAVDPLTGKRAALFHPRDQLWTEHFEWGEDNASIVGKTDIGRATVAALKLILKLSVEMRKALVQLGVYPPKDLEFLS